MKPVDGVRKFGSEFGASIALIRLEKDMGIEPGRSEVFGKRFGTLGRSERKSRKTLTVLRLTRINFTL